MWLRQNLLATTILQGQALAELTACRVGVNRLTFNYTPLGMNTYSSVWDRICGYPPSTGTFLLCTYEISSNNTDLLPKIYKGLSKTCQDYSSYGYSVLL